MPKADGSPTFFEHLTGKSAEEVPAEETQAEAPVEETQTEETPVADAPAEDVSTEETQEAETQEEAPAEETQEEAPAEETQSEELELSEEEAELIRRHRQAAQDRKEADAFKAVLTDAGLGSYLEGVDAPSRDAVLAHLLKLALKKRPSQAASPAQTASTQDTANMSAAQEFFRLLK